MTTESTANKDIVHLRFSGRSYDDGGLDVKAMRIIIKFQLILTDLAKSLRRVRMGSLRGDPDFVSRVDLVVKRLDTGSTVVPMEAVGLRSELDLEDVPPELVRAANLVYDSCLAAKKDERLPSDLPQDFVPRIASIADNLLEETVLDFAPPEYEFTTLGRRESSKLRDWVKTIDTARTTIYGEVFQVNVRKKQCHMLNSSGGPQVAVTYQDEYESQVTEALKNHDSKSLMIEGDGEFNLHGQLLKINKVSKMELISDSILSTPSGKSVMGLIDRVMSDVPQDVWDKVPKDLAENHDNYL